jgi:hypothetical protein
LRLRQPTRLLELGVTGIAGLIWPPIGTEHNARRAGLYGLWACFLVGSDYLFSGISISPQLPDQVMLLSVPLSMVLSVIWIGLAYGIYRLSREAAVGALLLYLITRSEHLWHRWFVRGASADTFEVGLTLILVLMLLHGVRGVSACHRIRLSAIDPPVRAGA